MGNKAKIKYSANGIANTAQLKRASRMARAERRRRGFFVIPDEAIDSCIV
jgi:hypothetical protein